MLARFSSCWHAAIGSILRSGQRVLIAAHGNSLRALVKCLDAASEQAIVELKIPTGQPLVHERDDDPRRHAGRGRSRQGQAGVSE